MSDTIRILSKCEMRDLSHKFIESVVTYEKSTGEYFIGRTSAVRSHGINEDNLLMVITNPLLIPNEHIFPVYKPGIKLASQTDIENGYIKIPKLHCYSTHSDPEYMPSVFLQEVKTLEELSRSPHPNIVKYLGCVVKDERIIGICLEKYEDTLYDRTWIKRQAVDKEVVMNSVQNAARHLHSLDLCHNDISLANIMFRKDNTVVLIDFDSCRRNGESMGRKKGTPGYCDISVKVSTFDNDEYSIKRVKEYLDGSRLP